MQRVYVYIEPLEEQGEGVRLFLKRVPPVLCSEHGAGGYLQSSRDPSLGLLKRNTPSDLLHDIFVKYICLTVKKFYK